MNYLKVYCNLIRKAEKRTPPEGYTEKHHTFPISIFGKNNRVVVLTAREHYIAHALLEKICIKRYGVKHQKTKKMTYAFWAMNTADKYKNRHKNSHIYNFLRERYSNIKKGKPVHTEKSRQKLSQIHKNKTLSEEHKKKISEGLKKAGAGKYVRTPEQLLKMKNSRNLIKYHLKHKNGTELVIDSMKEFCKKNPHLDRSAMNKVGRGVIKQYKGWTVKKLDD